MMMLLLNVIEMEVIVVCIMLFVLELIVKY